LRLSSLSQALWPFYPTHTTSRDDTDMTRMQVLTAHLDGDLDTVAAIGRLLLSDSIPYSITCPGPAPAPPPLPPPAPRRSAAPSPSGAAAPSPSAHASTAADRPDRYTSALSTVYSMRNISQYDTPARQVSGGPLESLSRACAEFSRVCDAFSVPASARAICLLCAMRQSDLKVLSPLTDSRGRTESQLRDLISERVNTPARALRVRNMWHATTLAGKHTLPDDTAVTHFDRVLSHLSLRQTQLPPSYQTSVML